jgi:hypothetical protein
MPTKQHDESGSEIDKQERHQLSAKIGDHVLRTLGQASGLHRLQIRPLWKDHYRVNVLVGIDFVSAKVAHSYFVVADSAGNIIRSNPQINREYRPALLARPVPEGDLPCPSNAT